MNWVSIGSDNGLSPGRCQAIPLTNAELSSSGHLRTNFTDFFLSKFKHCHWIKCSWKCRQQFPAKLSRGRCVEVMDFRGHPILILFAISNHVLPMCYFFSKMSYHFVDTLMRVSNPSSRFTEYQICYTTYVCVCFIYNWTNWNAHFVNQYSK